jgi:hypothetical protein
MGHDLNNADDNLAFTYLFRVCARPVKSLFYHHVLCATFLPGQKKREKVVHESEAEIGELLSIMAKVLSNQ